MERTEQGIERVDLAVVGMGAAGLMASICAGRAAHAGAGREAAGFGKPLRIVGFDGAKKIGIKILVAGGGRCNVTHHAVTEQAYAGGPRRAIRSVLQRFGVERTVEFFAELGVELKREETGKLFPVTDDAHTVLNALLRAARDAGVEIRHPDRVHAIERTDHGFVVRSEHGAVSARRVILSTGGRALPRSGSDGGGYALAEALGHSMTEHVVPALVPLVLDAASPLRGLAGITVDAAIELRSGTGKRLERFENSMLCAHFGLSGPAAMDISRYWTMARFEDAGAHLVVNWLPRVEREAADRELQGLGKRSVGRWLKELLPERLAEAVCQIAGIEPGTPGAELTRESRRGLLSAMFEMPLPVVGDRGFTHAEVTAGGVPLSEITLSTMASKRCAGLHLCGEICDVDGRIGGFNFQWAWASGFVAGTAAALAAGDG
ncbi:MAG: NAD(P)/FAD-dependent oxidoreductase [Phycisphaerales bacterium JB037]